MNAIELNRLIYRTPSVYLTHSRTAYHCVKSIGEFSWEHLPKRNRLVMLEDAPYRNNYRPCFMPANLKMPKEVLK